MEGFCRRNFCSMESRVFSSVPSASMAFVFFLLLFAGVFIYSDHRTASYLFNNQEIITSSNLKSKKIAPSLPLTCPAQLSLVNSACAKNHSAASLPAPPLHSPPPTRSISPAPACPDYFRWIHEDLRPWATTGITKTTLESSKIYASFRLIVIDGRAYVHHYHTVFETRDVFTIWGIVQLLRRYPGRLPDLDIMFNCEDTPTVAPSVTFNSPPPPLFRYCKDYSTVDIVIPDWSFWGWPEVNLRSWEVLMEELREASEERQWSKREPYAYWKGNPYVAEIREGLMKCNVTGDMDWKAMLFIVNWEEERRQGFRSSNLATQCSYRYNIYVEGTAWSVSEKYIFGCDSAVLYVESQFQDFVSRGLRPGRHYWPIPQKDMCWAIKQAVHWGNKHQKEVEAIGKAGSRFINEELKMAYVYDYMLHLLTEYSKLLTYKPTRPEEATELCLESVACAFQGRVRDFLIESIEMEPSNSEPCSLPPPYSLKEVGELLNEKANGTQKVVESLMKKS